MKQDSKIVKRPKFVIMKFHLLAWLVVVAILSLSLTGASGLKLSKVLKVNKRSLQGGPRDNEGCHGKLWC
ncbi:hypothetical protein EB796_005589 [Bugula neritina]|uniref:Uncharacterized protein n=1 Tax=Bugula neritina TaxID=10212 RepID=A0A7J7KD47_BUGNE|nr:hypothetical protein EB796_005589 [Bugula neritina]